MRPEATGLAGFQARLGAALLDGKPDGAGARVSARSFRVHRSNMLLGLIGALRSRYPIALRIVGDEFFNEMARRYVLARPPESAMLLTYGTGLADFAAALPETRQVPYLPDVLRLESAWTEAYHAADADPARPEDLASLHHGALSDVTVALHPSMRLLRSAHPIVTIWAANQPDGAPEALGIWTGEDALIVRPRLAVDTIRLDDGEFEFLAALDAGQRLGSAFEAALAAEPDFDIAAALARLVSAGIATRFDLSAGRSGDSAEAAWRSGAASAQHRDRLRDRGHRPGRQPRAYRVRRTS